MNNKIKKIIGIFLIFLGITGWFIPILQGWLLIILGAVLLGNKHLIMVVEKLKKKCINFWKKCKK